MEKCKYCYDERLVKNGFVRGKQRFRCQSCFKNQVPGDERAKYDNALRRRAMAMYLNSSGIRSIGRVLKVPHQLVARWIENAGKIVEREIMNLHLQPRNISILEMDELFTYVQKNSGTHEYGWLLIGTEMKLLRLTSAAGNGKTRGSFTGSSAATK
jgi:transposase-like protein